MNKCQALTQKGKLCDRKTNEEYCFQHQDWVGNHKNPYVLFTEEDRQDIMNNYNMIVKGSKPCMEYPLDKVIKAARGIYIYPDPIPEEKGKDELCQTIMDSYKKKQDPIVHEDSITAWGNQAAEIYGLTVGDILQMKPGQKMDLILLDRNVGDYLHGSKVGEKFDPKKRGFSYATYTHNKGLKGILDMIDVGVIHDPFQWEINLHGIGQNMFWGPIPKGYPIKKIDPGVKVGWRGPAIRMENAEKLPSYFVHYDTWWDDYLPFRTHAYTFLEKK